MCFLCRSIGETVIFVLICVFTFVTGNFDFEDLYVYLMILCALYCIKYVACLMMFSSIMFIVIEFTFECAEVIVL